MAELFWIIVGNLLCFWAGVRWGHHRALMRTIHALSKNPGLLDNVIKEYQQELAELTEAPADQQTARKVSVEQIGSQFYVFAQDNREFLGQSTTREAAIKLAQQRDPRITVVD